MHPPSQLRSTGLLFWLTALALLLLAAGACGGGSSHLDQTGPSQASATVIGTFDDRFDFRGFGMKLDGAIQHQDLSFFVDNVKLQGVRCDETLPSPPRSCAGAAAGSEVPAVLLSLWEGDDSYLDSDQYRDFMNSFLNDYARDERDSYGGAAPQLYAYAVIQPGLRPSPVGDQTVETILTRIAPGPSGPAREALVVTTTFDGERWAVTSLTRGPGTFLEPTGPRRSPAPSGGVFEFWRRWQD